MINSKSTMSLQPNGNNTPVWKALGYASYQDYINATSGANGNKGIVSPWKGSQAPVSVYDGLKTPSVKMPSLDKYAGFIGGGTGGSTGGVTKEGVVIGNPNVNNSTFNNISAPKATSDDPVKKTVTTPSTPTPTATTPTTPAQEETAPPPVARTDEGSYNGTSSFLEWYKENYGVDYDPSVGFSRREGMNDGVWNVGTNLYNYYLQGLDHERRKADEEANRNTYYDEQLETLLGEYSASREALDKSKRQSQQNASITLDKLKKYLPTQIKAQGLGGLGVSESTMLQAYNNYNNDMGAIESDYQANKTSLDVGENNSKNTLENYRQDALQKIAEKYGAAADARQAEAGRTSNNIFSAYETQVQAELERRRQEVQDIISNSSSTSINELMGYIQGLNGKIDKEAYDNLVSSAQQRVDENTRYQQERDKAYALETIKDGIADFEANGDYEGALQYLEKNKGAFSSQDYQGYYDRISYLANKYKEDTEKQTKEDQEEKDKRIITGQEAFEYNGGQYQITSQLKSDANEIKRNNDFKDKLKAAGFTDPYDKNIPNGTTFEIKADNRGSNDFNFWDDIGAFLLSPFGAGAWDSWGNWNTLYVTYYNGQWYRSDKKV